MTWNFNVARICAIGICVMLSLLGSLSCELDAPAAIPTLLPQTEPQTGVVHTSTPTRASAVILKENSAETDQSNPVSHTRDVLPARTLYDECNDVKHCQEIYGDAGDPVLIYGEVVRKNPRMLFVSSPETLRSLNDWDRKDPADRLAPIRTPEIKYALAARDGQVACDPSGEEGYGGGIRFSANESGRINLARSTRIAPPAVDSAWMGHVDQGDRIVVRGVYITNLFNPYIPVIYGCDVVEP